MGMTWVDFCLLRQRRQHESLIESRIFNVLGVVAYNACCYLIAVLPPAGGWESRPLRFVHPGIRIGFGLLGAVLICVALVLLVLSIKQRRVLGLQDVAAGLLTSGVYRHFRHPIYTGILWISFGLALVTRNQDGLWLFPGLLGVLTLQAVTEERYDMGVRFQGAYLAYRRTAGMFGPGWLWGVLVVVIVFLVAVARSQGIG